MEKQIQTLTSELNHLKNNRNKVTTFETKNHSQQQSQTTTHCRVCYHLVNYEYFNNMKTHLH